MSRINLLGFPTIKQFSLLFVALRLQSSFLCWILPADKVTHILVWFCLHVLVFLIKPGGSVSYTIYLYFFFCLLHLFPSYCSPDLSPSPKSCPMNQSGWQCVAVKEPVRVIRHVKLGQDLVGLRRQQEKKRFWKIPQKQQLLFAFQRLYCNYFQF